MRLVVGLEASRACKHSKGHGVTFLIFSCVKYLAGDGEILPMYKKFYDSINQRILGYPYILSTPATIRILNSLSVYHSR